MFCDYKMPRPFPLLLNQCALAVIVLTTLIYRSHVDACSRQLIRIQLNRDGCIPKSVIAFACNGACTSYTRPSTDNPSELQHFCQCCDALNFRERALVIECWNIRDIRVTLQMPIGLCMCRPCSDMPEYIIPADNFWNRGKKNVPLIKIHDDYLPINGTHSNTTDGLNVSYIDSKDTNIQVSVESLYDVDSIQ